MPRSLVGAVAMPKKRRAPNPRRERQKFFQECGQRIAERREALGLTQTTFAERSGLARPYVAKVEAGEVAFNLHIATRLAVALEWTMNDLCGE